MRKLKTFITIILICLLVVACSNSNKTPPMSKEKALMHLNKGDWSFDRSRRIMWKFGIREGKFTSNKHRYRIFLWGSHFSISHDPECPECLIIYD